MSIPRSKIITDSIQAPVTNAPSDLPKPHWLKKGEFHSPEWVVADDLPSSPKPEVTIRWDVQLFDPRRSGEICRLTDPEYFNLLDTIRCQSLTLRLGKYEIVTAAETHGTMSRRLIGWAVWMISNSIYRFADLGHDDFDSYAAAVCYGPGVLLGFAPRLVAYVTKLKDSGGELPRVKRPRTSAFELKTSELLQAAGIDPYMGRTDDATTYELAKLSAEEELHLTKGQVERLAKGVIPPRKRCAYQVFSALYPWHHQWLMRDEISGDRIVFNPFENTSIGKMSGRMGVAQGRTKTPPIKQTMELIDKSIRWVLDYAPVLLDLRDKYLETAVSEPSMDRRRSLLATQIADTVIPDGPGCPFPLNANSRRAVVKEGVEFGVAVNRYIPTACAIVICAFTARRHNEVLTLRAVGPNGERCISHDGNYLWIESFVEKTCQAWVKTPCNEIVAEAVAVLERWSAPARFISGKPELFQLRRLTCEPVVRFYLHETLKDYVSFLNLTQLMDGSRWDFLPHQLRRFFAITYFWRYHYRNLAALSYHLRHFDPAITQIYVTEPEAGAIFREVGKEHTITLLAETAIGKRNLSGPFGERFKRTVTKLYSRYSRSLRVVAPKLAWKVLERYVNKSGRRFKAMPWGYCACGTRQQELNTARCLTVSSEQNLTKPDFAKSSPTVCCGCPHHATENIFEPFLQEQIEFHERVAADPHNGRILRLTSQEHIAKLRDHCQRSFQDSKPVEVPDGKSR